MEVAGVATPPRSILDSRPELEGCAPRDGWRKLGTRPRRHGVRAGGDDTRRGWWCAIDFWRGGGWWLKGKSVDG